MHNFLREASHRQNDRITDKPAWSHNIRLGGDNDVNFPRLCRRKRTQANAVARCEFTYLIIDDCM